MQYLFGLAQDPACIQQLISEVLTGLEFAFGYANDILVFCPDTETDLQHLCVLFDRLRETNIKFKEIKCSVFR